MRKAAIALVTALLISGCASFVLSDYQLARKTDQELLILRNYSSAYPNLYAEYIRRIDAELARRRDPNYLNPAKK